jgi:heparan-alpha-glucosaminide N-acetyltransferase
MQPTVARQHAVDAYRGIVMFMLIPDLLGGFSLYAMARQFPGDRLWGDLAAWFTHVQWSGCSVWDLVMPSFVFLVGVAMPFSVAARRRRGDSERRIFTHVLLRAAALFLLALFLEKLQDPARSYLDELWPFTLLAAGLGVPGRLAAMLGISSSQGRESIELAWWLAILIASALRLYVKGPQLGDYDFNQIFTQLALASVFAFLFVGKPRRVQIGSLCAIVASYWAFFALYPIPPAGFDPSKVGVQPGDEVFSGLFAHWNKNTNAAAAFDVWFLNLLPRAEPFLFQAKGLQTLNFIPTIASMIFGVMAGEMLLSGQAKTGIRNTLLLSGLLVLMGGLIAGQWLCPIVKSIWTPSWTLFSSGVALLVLAALYQLCDVSGWRAWIYPFAILGANSILLYTLAYYRWRFLSIPTRLARPDMFAGSHGPLLESLVLLAMLWAVAYLLYRARIFVRL